MLETESSKAESNCFEPVEWVSTCAVERRSHRNVTRNLQAPPPQGDVGEVTSLRLSLYGGFVLGNFHWISDCLYLI